MEDALHYWKNKTTEGEYSNIEQWVLESKLNLYLEGIKDKELDMRVIGLDTNRIGGWIPNKFKKFILEVTEDSEVVEVILKDGCYSTDGETMWVFCKNNYEHGNYSAGKYTLKGVKEDLRFWLDNIETA